MKLSAAFEASIALSSAMCPMLTNSSRVLRESRTIQIIEPICSTAGSPISITNETMPGFLTTSLALQRLVCRQILDPEPLPHRPSRISARFLKQQQGVEAQAQRMPLQAPAHVPSFHLRALTPEDGQQVRPFLLRQQIKFQGAKWSAQIGAQVGNGKAAGQHGQTGSLGSAQAVQHIPQIELQERTV